MERAVIISRDISIILLVIEWLIIGALPLLLLLKITQGIRRPLPKARPALRRVHEQLCLGLGYVERVALALRKPFEWQESARARIARLVSRS